MLKSEALKKLCFFLIRRLFLFIINPHQNSLAQSWLLSKLDCRYNILYTSQLYNRTIVIKSTLSTDGIKIGNDIHIHTYK